MQCLVRLSHCLIKLVSVSGSAGYPRHGFLVKNQYHECLIWNPRPLRRKPVLRSGNESKPGIELWMTENDNEWAFPFTHGLKKTPMSFRRLRSKREDLCFSGLRAYCEVKQFSSSIYGFSHSSNSSHDASLGMGYSSHSIQSKLAPKEASALRLLHLPIIDE